MIRLKKREILNIISSFEEINSKLKQGTISDGQEFFNFLSETQSLALSLGNRLEEDYSNLSEAISVLEGYCEGLYKLSTCDKESKVSVIVELDIEVEQFRKIIESLIPNDKKEIVFLPYKASMWDCFDLIWKEYSEDESVDVYVVPIPYYDKNANGDAIKWHYEGNILPSYVPITNWEEYDLESRHPDIIYIHNPYDKYNSVTSIHPDFYCSRINKFTECLTYIPYFVSEESNPDDLAAIEKIKDYCILPGVIYSHKTILQSENMKRIYVNIMSEFFGENTRPMWEERFSAEGSPKIKKIKNTRREDVDIPAEWADIIKKKDGTYRKVILYNTSVVALLKKDKAMIKKIKDTLAFFYNNRDKVALIWRPHPLLKATIEAKKPHLSDVYQKIVDKYRKEGWGIYDETPDLDRAIILCDGYFGDYSSVITLCKAVDKPILIQSTDVLNEG